MVLKQHAVRWDDFRLKNQRCEFCDSEAEYFLDASYLFGRRKALLCGAHYRLWMANRWNL